MAINIPQVLEQLCYRYPSLLVDVVVEHEPGRRIVALKNVTVSEEYFQGHFPGMPLMPGVLMIETLSQVAGLLLLRHHAAPPAARAYLRGVNRAKFRRQVVPGDQLRLEVSLARARLPLARVNAIAYLEDQVVAEAELLMGVVPRAADIHPTAIVHEGARIGAGTLVGPHTIVGEHVRIGRNCRIGASSVIDGWTTIGDGNEIFPLASIGLIPQDLKFRGEPTRLVIGNNNTFREFVTIHRGTQGGGGSTEIGHRNVFLAYAHVAHDCKIRNDTIFANGATLGGHVLVEDFATIGAFSGVHQFCRVGRHAFIGGFSVVTKDALPFGKTVGNRARIYGLNPIGLVRRGFSPDLIVKLKRAYRYLLQSKLNTTHALARIETDPTLQCAEVQYLVDFIRTSKRGVTLRRAVRRVEEMATDE
ncbi:MAG: acyl-ACP--UDP-N-acetylglucosamine O-acyltransferase [Acidobacteria bacterium]|nr:acyl-ACP--UDP-N-acetylglucosamine O-acyltransferase [Acidobacteriota bacterium]